MIPFRSSVRTCKNVGSASHIPGSCSYDYNITGVVRERGANDRRRECRCPRHPVGCRGWRERSSSRDSSRASAP
jgi:hypothetical protein